MAYSHQNNPGNDRITTATRYALRVAFTLSVTLTAVDPATAMQDRLLTNGIGHGVHTHPIALWWLYQSAFVAIVASMVGSLSWAGRILARRAQRPRVALAVDVTLAVAGYALADTDGYVGAMPASAVAASTLTVALILAVIEHLR